MNRLHVDVGTNTQNITHSLNPPKTGAMIFDLDGTLINSAPDIAKAVNTTFAQMGYNTLDISDVEYFIGNGSRALIQGIFDHMHMAYDDILIATAVQKYLQNYYANPVVDTHFFPHVKRDLQTLATAGFGLGICTNKPHQLTAIVLEKLGIKDMFRCFLGADAVSYCKPHANHLKTAMTAMGTDCTTTFYIGDTEVDRACAYAANTPFFIVPWGGGNRMQSGGDTKIDRLSDLLDYCT